jgi:actin-related protein 8
LGRASDFYPKEVPNCIARPGNLVNRGRDPPVPGRRLQRLGAENAEERQAKKARMDNGNGSGNGNGHSNGDAGGQDEEDGIDPVSRPRSSCTRVMPAYV